MENRRAIEIMEDYLRKVQENLPEGLDGDIIEELRSHIIDMVNERGGLTVENVEWAIKRMGDPIKLAEEIAREEGYLKRKRIFEINLRWGDRTYRWGFELNEDIMEIFTSILWFIVVIVLFTSLGSIVYIFSTPQSGSIVDVLVNSIGSLISLLVFLFISMWLLSILSPENKRPVVRRIIKRKEKTLVRRTSYVKTGGMFFSGFFLIIIAVFIGWFTLSYSSFTFVTRIVGLSLAIAFAYKGSILVAHSIYMAFEGKESLAINFVGSLSILVMIPSLILINLYPSQLQVPIIKSTYIEIKSISDILKYVEFIVIPLQYSILVQFVSIILIVAIVLYVVLKAATFTREKKIYEYLST